MRAARVDVIQALRADQPTWASFENPKLPDRLALAINDLRL
jgi:hypothetical protein